MTASTGRSMEVTAWIVLLASLALFMTALVGIPYAILQFARRSTVAERALVESKTGSVMLESSTGITQVLATGQRKAEVPEGITVTTYPDASAYVRLFDQSVVHLRPNTSLGLRQMRRPRFDAGGATRHIGLALAAPAGQTAAATVGSTYGDVDFVVDTRHGQVRLAPDAQARIEVSDEGLEVVGGEGQVTVTGQGQAVPLGYDQRTVVRAGEAPQPPTAALKNVVADADFAVPRPADTPWEQVFDPALEVARVPGDATRERLGDGRTVMRFERRGSQGSPGDMYVKQALRTETDEASYLGVTGDLRVLLQDLPGGGTRLSEFPVILTLIAADADNDEFVWTAGFYARAPTPDDPAVPMPATPHQNVPLDEWYHFDSGNLLDESNPAGFARLGLPPPARLVRLLVKASGHDYVSEVDQVGVWLK